MSAGKQILWAETQENRLENSFFRIRHATLANRGFKNTGENYPGSGRLQMTTPARACEGRAALELQDKERRVLQNRVNPWGELVAVSDRGALMGNRGILHNAEKNVVRKCQHKSWVTCLLTFGDLQRPKPFSTLDNYSELFFLDEATAFAAGHRPCHFCQRERAKLFKQAWCAANHPGSVFVPQGELDAQLHRERTTRTGVKLTFEARVGELPLGTMFSYGEASYLVSPRGFLPWSFGGYGPCSSLSQDALVAVLTPRSVVAAFRQGFTPDVHPSAMRA